MLKLRAVINGREIIELNHRQPFVIPFTEISTSFILSNGFHYSRMVELTYQANGVYIYHVECSIDNIRLFYGIFLTFLLFGMYILTASVGFMIVANLPILFMLYLFYWERKTFIQLNAVGKI